ncbi:hypothetical protein EV363DRAFT_1408816 [Boletus edulis]|uniref:Uncharacterized protein n=1 Tax=Boletus edulis BED1 TaxID=1328754 RepID=A0AAD4BFF1_BOLED|nr:hypothetical protein EV363DRAFT_1408816 [Boletus edulis]KAF8425020.1 hypothetical protein L210DRAFT_3421551 [Boletus edulis BED1]
MSSNKDRLYVALHARGGVPTMPGGEDKYHWALVIAPKKEKDESRGIRMHAKNVVQIGGTQGWVYEQVDSISLAPTGSSLVRIRIAKIVDTTRLLETLRNIPVTSDSPTWNCVSWVRQALQALGESEGILGRRNLGWEMVRDAAMRYVTKKRDEGRFSQEGDWDTSKVPTYDLIEECETRP